MPMILSLLKVFAILWDIEKEKKTSILDLI